MQTIEPDPTTPLPGPPDPWASTDMPSRRGTPPFHMTDMIAAEPALAARILARHAPTDSGAATLARAIEEAVRAGTPVVVTGCGTSEHGALGVAEILGDALRGAGLDAPCGVPIALPRAAQAFELALDPPAHGLVVGISHEGGTAATNAALAAAHEAGATTAIITVTERSPGAALVDVVVETAELDQSWCHTVGYTSPLAAAAAIAGHLRGAPLDATAGRAVTALMEPDPTLDATATAIAGRLAMRRQLLVVATGADRTAGRELTLKVEEGSWLPAAYRDLETFLHGHLAATDAEQGLVLILTDRDHRPERVARARGALAAARVIGVDAAAILATGIDAMIPPDLTPAGRLVVPEAPSLAAPVAALLGSAVPLQTLTERIARARGVDPDPIHRDVDRYREAADAAGG